MAIRECTLVGKPESVLIIICYINKKFHSVVNGLIRCKAQSGRRYQFELLYSLLFSPSIIL